MSRAKSKKGSSRSRLAVKSSLQQPQEIPTYRVWKMDAALKDAMTQKRETRGQTVREFVNESVLEELPDLVVALCRLGVNNSGGGCSPVRCPMLDETLSDLRRAAQKTGLDQFQLFAACLRLATRRKRRRSKVTKIKAGG